MNKILKATLILYSATLLSGCFVTGSGYLGKNISSSVIIPVSDLKADTVIKEDQGLSIHIRWHGENERPGIDGTVFVKKKIWQTWYKINSLHLSICITDASGDVVDVKPVPLRYQYKYLVPKEIEFSRTIYFPEKAHGFFLVYSGEFSGDNRGDVYRISGGPLFNN